MRLRRSLTYVSGFYDDLLERSQKVVDGPSDVLILDTQDGVAPANKPIARKNILEVLKKLDRKDKEICVRVNEVDTPYFELDIKEIIEPGLPTSVRLPECHTPEAPLKLDAELTRIEQKYGLEPNSIEIQAMIESPLGIRNAYDIATCCDRVTCITIGMQDMNRACGFQRRYIDNEFDLLYVRQKIVCDARAAGVQVVDTVLLTDNVEINEKYTRKSKEFGFDGRAVHTPEEAAYANKVYYPTPEQLDWAVGVKKEYERCEAENIQCVYEGKVICYAVYKQACGLAEMKK